MNNKYISSPDAETSKLKACPFCRGNNAFVEQSTFASSYVICNDCKARGPDATQESDDEDEPGKDAAIVAWNTRATPPPTPAETVTVALPGAGNARRFTLAAMFRG